MSLVNTLMQPLWARYPNPLDKNEVRNSRYGAWNFIKNQSNRPDSLLDADTIEKARMSMGNTVQVPVLNAEDVTITNTRSCTIAADSETSALVTLTFTTYSFGFTMTPSRHYNNEIGYQALFEKKMNEYLIKFAKTLDTASANTMEAARNTYFPSAITNYYSNVGNALQVPQAGKNDFLNQLSAITQEMDYYGNVNVIGSTSMLPNFQRLAAQGAGNDENDAFQFDLLPYMFHNSNRIVNGAGVQSTLYAIPDGMIQTVNRNTPDNIAGHSVGDHKVWGLSRMPIVDLEMGTYYTKDCSDLTALDGGGARMSHLDRTLLEGFWFDTDICFVTAYNSDPSNTYRPILKAEISAT